MSIRCLTFTWNCTCRWNLFEYQQTFSLIKLHKDVRTKTFCPNGLVNRPRELVINKTDLPITSCIVIEVTFRSLPEPKLEANFSPGFNLLNSAADWSPSMALYSGKRALDHVTRVPKGHVPRVSAWARAGWSGVILTTMRDDQNHRTGRERSESAPEKVSSRHSHEAPAKGFTWHLHRHEHRQATREMFFLHQKGKKITCPSWFIVPRWRLTEYMVDQPKDILDCWV